MCGKRPVVILKRFRGEDKTLYYIFPWKPEVQTIPVSILQRRHALCKEPVV